MVEMNLVQAVNSGLRCAMADDKRVVVLGEDVGVDGGVSGRIAQPILWPMVRKLVELDAAPVIGPSVWNYGDIDTLFTCLGAAAVHFGAIFLRGLQGPCLPNRFVNQYDAPTAT